MSANETIDTLTIKGMDANVPREVIIDGKPCKIRGWSVGNALEREQQFEDFIRSVSFGEVEDPETAAHDLLASMNRA